MPLEQFIPFVPEIALAVVAVIIIGMGMACLWNNRGYQRPPNNTNATDENYMHKVNENIRQGQLRDIWRAYMVNDPKLPKTSG